MERSASPRYALTEVTTVPSASVAIQCAAVSTCVDDMRVPLQMKPDVVLSRAQTEVELSAKRHGAKTAAGRREMNVAERGGRGFTRQAPPCGCA